MIHDEDELDPFNNIDDFFLPEVPRDTPDMLLARELKEWKDEEQRKIKEEMIKEEEDECHFGIKVNKLSKDGD